jgi:hypothetical protein
VSKLVANVLLPEQQSKSSGKTGFFLSTMGRAAPELGGETPVFGIRGPATTVIEVENDAPQFRRDRPWRDPVMRISGRKAEYFSY